LYVAPKKQFIVGNVSEEELNSLKEEPHNEENSNDHDHQKGIKIRFSIEDWIFI